MLYLLGDSLVCMLYLLGVSLVCMLYLLGVSLVCMLYLLGVSLMYMLYLLGVSLVCMLCLLGVSLVYMLYLLGDSLVCMLYLLGDSLVYICCVPCYNVNISVHREEIDQIKKELNTTRLLQLSEAHKLLQCERQLHTVERERETLQGAVLKVTVELEEMRLKYEPGTWGGDLDRLGALQRCLCGVGISEISKSLKSDPVSILKTMMTRC